MTRLFRLSLVLVAAATLLGSPAGDAVAQTPTLGGYQGSAAASGLHVLYRPEGLLPISSPVDYGVPDALATIASGPATFARASVADPGDLLANPDALLALGVSGWQAGTIPPYPFRISASSGVGEPSAEQSPAPGLDSKVHADSSGSRAEATTPAVDAPAILNVGSMSSAATTVTDGSRVTVTSRSVISNVDLLGMLEIDSIVTDLTADSEGQATVLSGGTLVSGATFMGQPVTIDANGVHAGEGSATPNPALAGLNDLLANAGIRITLAGPVEQAGGSSGQLLSSGLRIDLELSERTMPAIGTIADALPPLDSPIPGAPSVEDLVVAARTRHLVAIDLGRGAVSLTARPGATRGPSTAPTASASRPATALPSGGVSSGGVAAIPAATPARLALNPAATAPAVAGDVPALSFSEGLGALALIALLLQPFVGDRLARGARIVLAGGQAGVCPREER